MENNNEIQVEEKKPQETQVQEAEIKVEDVVDKPAQEPAQEPKQAKPIVAGTKKIVIKKKARGLINKNKQLIMNDEDKRKKSVKMGVWSIVLSLIILALVYPMMWIGAQIIIYGFTHFLLVIGNVVVIAIGLGFPGLLLYVLILQFKLTASQLSIRKDWFGWLCLAFSILTVIGMIVVGFFSITPVLNSVFG